MNVYDFDKTVYDGDSTVDFYFYCLRKRPRIILCIFRQAYGALLHAAHRADTKTMKEYFFSFLVKIDDADKLVEEFWRERRSRIKKWYMQKKDETDVIISASPEFLLRPVCRMLGIAEPLATRTDLRTGRINGENCKGQEKVRRFFEKYPDGMIDCFYSDSRSDTPLADIAKEAFLVNGDRISQWTR